MGNEVNYNPDILSCLANLSNDEVFTPPELVNRILDMLPSELWSNPDTRVLDPCCKSGVFLREIAKRMLEGEKEAIPDLQQRIDHIFHNQLYGIAITELTSLLSRRSLYCSKLANGQYSVSHFDDTCGNIRYSNPKHSWDKDGNCIFCGASSKEYDRGEEAENYAYEFIHLTPKQIKELSVMHFDLIIGNPPYQISDGGNGDSSKPIYHKFILQSKKLKPRYLVMITPSRWFTGGKGLDSFRNEMLTDRHLLKIVDYKNAKDCFPSVSIGGGVNYFLWARDKTSDCEITNIINGQETTEIRRLDEFPTFIRFNESVDIIKKIHTVSPDNIVGLLSSRNPFGLSTKERGVTKPTEECTILLISSSGTGYISKNLVTQGSDYIDKWKVMISRTSSEHAGEPDKSGKYKVLTTIKLLAPGEVCTDSYIIGCPTNDKTIAKNFMNYLTTTFSRFLILQTLSSINLSREQYAFVPALDFSRSWTDEELYKKYGLTESEIDFIESMIKPMNVGKQEA